MFLDQHRDVVSFVHDVICLSEAIAREFDHAYNSTVVLLYFCGEVAFLFGRLEQRKGRGRIHRRKVRDP
jgi:hypothetical protein